MHSLTLARRRPLQFIDRALNPVPNSAAIHVIFGHQLISTLGGVYSGFFAIRLDRGLGSTINLKVGEHRSLAPLTRWPVQTSTVRRFKTVTFLHLAERPPHDCKVVYNYAASRSE